MYLLLMSQQQKGGDDDNLDDEDGLKQHQDLSSSLVTNGLQSHPVFVILKKLELASEMTKSSLGERSDAVEEQLATLVKAASMTMDGDGDDDDEQSSSSSEQDESSSAQKRKATADEPKEQSMEMEDQQDDESNPEESDADDDDEGGEAEDLDDAKFALRSGEVMAATMNARRKESNKNPAKKKKSRTSKLLSDDMDDYGDLDETNIADRKTFAATLNSIEQRSSSKKNKNKKKQQQQNLEDIDDPEFEDFGGYDMMDEDGEDGFGGGAMDDDEMMMEDEMYQARKKKSSKGDKSSSFYSAIEGISKTKKAFKESKYSVAPKYPNLEGEVSGKLFYKNCGRWNNTFHEQTNGLIAFLFLCFVLSRRTCY